MLKVVIDTNVLVSALLKSGSTPALIISMVLQNHITLCLSDDIFSEYKEVLAYSKFKKLNRHAINRLLLQLKQYSFWVDPQVTITTIKSDPSDNIFLKCALEAEADFFITGNTKHFTFEMFRQTRIVKPVQFLSIYAGLLFE